MENNTQATAYAMLGLKSNTQVSGAKESFTKAEKWMVNSMLNNGAWGSYNDGVEPLAGEISPQFIRSIISYIINLIKYTVFFQLF